MQLLVDPIIVSPPEHTDDPEHVIYFLSCLDAWSDVLRTDSHQLFLSERCLEALVDANNYPDYYMFQQLCARSGLVEVDPKTAFSACKRIVENCPRFEERAQLVGRVDVYPDLVVHPDLSARLIEPLASAFRETMGHVTFAFEHMQPPPVTDLGLATHIMNEAESLHISARVETDDGELSIETDLPLIFSPEHLRHILGLPKIWRDNPQALDWAIEDLERTHWLEGEYQIAPYCFTSDFNQSIEDNGYYTRVGDLKRIFYHIAKLVTGIIPPQSTVSNHELRKPNSLDQEGHLWTPWRLWLASGPAAMRLHYWRYKDRFILSRVVPHEDLRIGPVPQIPELHSGKVKTAKRAEERTC